jgi:hypothetical protein
MEVRSWYWRTRPTTRGHVFPANHHFESCRPCTRVLARARSDVPVSYPRLVVCVEHTPKREARRLRPAPALFFMTFHRRDRPRESTRATPCSTLDELVAAPDAAVRAEELELEPHAFHCARSLWRPARRDLAYLLSRRQDVRAVLGHSSAINSGRRSGSGSLVDLSSLLGRRRLRIEEGARTEALSRRARSVTSAMLPTST